jgi:hypothetical protein
MKKTPFLVIPTILTLLSTYALANQGEVFCLDGEVRSGTFNCIVSPYAFKSKDANAYELDMSDKAVYRKGIVEPTVKTSVVKANGTAEQAATELLKTCENLATKDYKGVNHKLVGELTSETSGSWTYSQKCQFEIPAKCEEGKLLSGGKCRVLNLSQTTFFATYDKYRKMRKVWIDPQYDGVFALGFMETENVPNCRQGSVKFGDFEKFGNKTACLILKK